MTPPRFAKTWVAPASRGSSEGASRRAGKAALAGGRGRRRATGHRLSWRLGEALLGAGLAPSKPSARPSPRRGGQPRLRRRAAVGSAAAQQPSRLSACRDAGRDARMAGPRSAKVGASSSLCLSVSLSLCLSLWPALQQCARCVASALSALATAARLVAARNLALVHSLLFKNLPIGNTLFFPDPEVGRYFSKKGKSFS